MSARERIVRVGGKPIERRRRVHVPEGGDRSGALDRRHARLEQRVEDTDAARFDDQIGGSRAPSARSTPASSSAG